MAFDGFRWLSMAFDGFWWVSMDFDGFRWTSMGSDGFRWVLVGFDGYRWVSVGSGGFWWILFPWCNFAATLPVFSGTRCVGGFFFPFFHTLSSVPLFLMLLPNFTMFILLLKSDVFFFWRMIAVLFGDRKCYWIINDYLNGGVWSEVCGRRCVVESPILELEKSGGTPSHGFETRNCSEVRGKVPELKRERNWNRGVPMVSRRGQILVERRCEVESPSWNGKKVARFWNCGTLSHDCKTILKYEAKSLNWNGTWVGSAVSRMDRTQREFAPFDSPWERPWFYWGTVSTQALCLVLEWYTGRDVSRIFRRQFRRLPFSSLECCFFWLWWNMYWNCD